MIKVNVNLINLHLPNVSNKTKNSNQMVHHTVTILVETIKQIITFFFPLNRTNKANLWLGMLSN